MGTLRIMSWHLKFKYPSMVRRDTRLRGVGTVGPTESSKDFLGWGPKKSRLSPSLPRPRSSSYFFLSFSKQKQNVCNSMKAIWLATQLYPWNV